MKKLFVPLAGVCGLALLLALTFRMGAAQGVSPLDDRFSPDAPTARSDYIPIQGRLTDDSGNPLTGAYDLTVSLYEAPSGGSPLCSDTIVGANVDNGLFSTYANFLGCGAFDGRQLYLGLQVGSDPEMAPRHPIDNVPLAWTLRPGAEISATMSNNAILDIDNYSPTGRGLRAEAQAETGVNMAVIGASRSPEGFGGYFYNNGGGVGLYGQSDSGPAIAAGGTGIIRSAAQTSLWISGNGVRPFSHNDSTIIDLDTIGGAKITRGATAGNKNVMLPITIPGPLYGQDVKVVGLDVYYLSDTEFDSLTSVLLRRQTGVCSDCYLSLLHDTDDHICDENIPANAQGCVQHFDLTTNNILTSDSGILYLTLEFAFSGPSTFVEIGGVRLVLEHE